MEFAANEVTLRRLVPAMRIALQGRPPGPLGLLVALSGLFTSHLAFTLRHDVPLVPAVLVSLASQVVAAVLVEGMVRGLGKARVGPLYRPQAVVGVFALVGVAQASLVVAVIPATSWALWRQQLAPFLVDTVVWFSVSALMLDWMDRAAAQRMRLDTAYRELLAARAATVGTLAETDRQLAELTASTRRAIRQISDQLQDGISLAELNGCIEQIDELVDREVRPHSHELAQMPTEVRPQRVPLLWPSTKSRVNAIVWRWPVAHPFRLGLAAVSSFPAVLAQLAVAAPPLRSALLERTLAALSVQLGCLALAALFLTPLLRRLPHRLASALTFATYIGLYAVGVAGLVRDGRAGIETPLGAHLYPSVYALLFGVAAAAAAQHRAESAGAAQIVALTGRSLSSTRQHLWARRRRLALSLHGRVQANLTAAGLLLQRVRDELACDGVLDVRLIDQVREAMRLALQVDNRSPGSAYDRLQRVAGVWAGTMTVTLALSEQSRARINADQDSADACVEVVREILLNAARHGGATRAEVSIRPAEQGMVRIRVRETSGRPPTAQRPGTGLGETMIDSVADRWWVHHEGSHRVTTALLTVGPVLISGEPAHTHF